MKIFCCCLHNITNAVGEPDDELLAFKAFLQACICLGCVCAKFLIYQGSVFICLFLASCLTLCLSVGYFSVVFCLLVIYHHFNWSYLYFLPMVNFYIFYQTIFLKCIICLYFNILKTFCCVLCLKYELINKYDKTTPQNQSPCFQTCTTL